MQHLQFLKPNTAIMGYALFLAINAAGIWGGWFPFLPANFQTSEIIIYFFCAQAIVVAASYFFSALGVYYFPAPTRKFLVFLAGIPYFLGWCALIAAIYIDNLAYYLVVAAGALLGLGSAGFYMLWQRLFASFDESRGAHDLILGTAYGAVLYFALYAIPRAVTVFLIPLMFLPLFGLAIVLTSRIINLKQPMFEDVPKQHPKVYKQVLRDVWRSALCVGALGFCTGIMRSLAIVQPELGDFVNLLSMLGCLICCTVLLIFWQFKNVRLNVVGAYRIAFPILITLFMLIPVLREGYVRWQAAILYAAYSCSIVLMMLQSAQISRDRGINPVFSYGFFGCIIYALHDLGFLVGTFSEHMPFANTDPLVTIALVAVYLLSIMFFVGQGGFRRFAANTNINNNEIELVAPVTSNAKQQKPDLKRQATKTQTNPSTSHDKSNSTLAAKKEYFNPAANYTDRLSKQVAIVKFRYGLTAREAEVMELLARGNTVASIAERLVVSQNTIRTHSKRIYTKLDVHKRQEMLYRIETCSPNDLD